VWAAIHGEEHVTLQAAHQLLRTMHADDACAVVVPVVNPDGVLAGTRQNAHGVDLNRNFPTPDWSAEPQPTFWPTTMTRTAEHRTQLSSPGTHAGSEPEVQALMKLIRDVSPSEVIDIHTPLNCLIARDDAALVLAQHIAEPAQMRIVQALKEPTPGDSAQWCTAEGATCVTYELELAPFPALWHRHTTSLARCITPLRRYESPNISEVRNAVEG
jgi:protein MpaA